MSEKHSDPNTPPNGSAAEPSDGKEESLPHVMNSGDLLNGKRELLIRHRGEIYRLLLTRNGKLILQK
ncbi:MAG: hypothetical protein CMJ77_09070 [Planctomycetaceae bacterium]|nr:hypothetical protein [Planctomycetaceae bacterium]